MNILVKTSTFFTLCFILSLGTSCENSSRKMGDHSSESHSHNGETHKHGESASEHSHKGDDADEHGHEHSFTYLNMYGEFRMDPEDMAVRNDPRNPSRISLTTSEEAGSMTRMVFYDHDDPNKMLADCGYEFVGSRPDPHYYPDESKSSIWDVFEQKKGYEGDCGKYQVVISRSPHGDPIHMHLRYGQDVEELLAMSEMAEDSANFNPWWSTYCDIDRNTSCAE